jgi:hypothetical protein
VESKQWVGSTFEWVVSREMRCFLSLLDFLLGGQHDVLSHIVGWHQELTRLTPSQSPNFENRSLSIVRGFASVPKSRKTKSLEYSTF